MSKHRYMILGAVTVVCIMVVVGCGSNIVKISSILNDPDKYMSRTVEIAGIVGKTYDIDLVITEAGAYQVDDGTGKIWVTTKTGTPAVGDKVWVKGKVGGGLKIAGENFGTMINETERETKK